MIVRQTARITRLILIDGKPFVSGKPCQVLIPSFLPVKDNYLTT